ncbi:SRPBCC family protein [Reyranella sp. CPCC 100927]|uniref:SRPBCC family protein n=1 Tax=Reyranella sp. CPCC 100927 TaxID=2599616 RepID=UPI0011B55BE5|nr:SRPBCC family protein [Reyranella sp. CPCC 100927]TWT11486.1 SRPBCC family protein [Reyranella sp. CPCC 100927]
MTATVDSRTISIRIERPWRTVYDFTSVPANFAAWAKGMGETLQRLDDHWIVQTPSSRMRVRFSEKNDFGVLDHALTASDGSEISVPLRVIANGGGSEVMLTVFRLPGMSDAALAADVDAVERDLHALKTLMES